MNRYQKIGILIIVTGIGMFVLGVSMFTYRGPILNPFISKMGMYSFFLWLPAIILGIVFMFLKDDKK